MPAAPAFVLFHRCLPALLCAAVLMFPAGCGEARPKHRVLEPQGEMISVDLEGVKNGGGVFYTYRAATGGTVDYFVYKDLQGNGRAMLDACRRCFRWRKGYRLEGGEAVCVRCGQRFHLEQLPEGVGSCVPLPLNSTQRGRILLIAVSELEKGAALFSKS